MSATSFKTFVAFGLISIGLNVIILGPNGFKNQIVAFYEKPELTIYPTGCIFTNCAKASAKCVIDKACRDTLGKAPKFSFCRLQFHTFCL